MLTTLSVNHSIFAQVDLQAMDRAHRLGQKKPVQVFRFITEGTVEEKIIERADRKLFLDAAVIQQGRLAEQNTSLEKDELMKMVRFGADQILNKKGGTYTDEDIDALIAKGEEKTSDIQAKLQTDVKHNLADFKLLSDADEEKGFMSFGGKDYSGGATQSVVGNFINLPSRQRKRNYDVDGYFREAMATHTGPQGEMKAVVSEAAAKKRKKGPSFHSFQLFNQEKLKVISDKERKLAEQKESLARKISELEARAKQAAGAAATPGHSREDFLKQAKELKDQLDLLTLSEEEANEKTRLLAEGFPDWSRNDFKAFCASLELHGRYNLAEITKDVANETGKSEKEIARYFGAFMTNYRRINDWKRIMDKVSKGEQKIIRLREIRDAIQEKIERHLEDAVGSQFAGMDENGEIPSANELLEYTWTQMTINYGSATRNRAYTEKEDAFLIYMMYRHGYGAAERIRMEIRRAWQFKFDFFFKSRSVSEIHKRCDMLVRVIEKENEDLNKEESPPENSEPVLGDENASGENDEAENEEAEDDEAEDGEVESEAAESGAVSDADAEPVEASA
jgi:SWI/SNF-related matrix-associated actin-dependent regulator of chromatin subfamily A member 5